MLFFSLVRFLWAGVHLKGVCGSTQVPLLCLCFDVSVQDSSSLVVLASNSDRHCAGRCQYFLWMNLVAHQTSIFPLEKGPSIYLGILGSLNCENKPSSLPFPLWACYSRSPPNHQVPVHPAAGWDYWGGSVTSSLPGYLAALIGLRLHSFTLLMDKDGGLWYTCCYLS